MNKIVLSTLVVGFVFSSGLVSCSKELKTQDVYRVSPPVILGEQTQVDLKSWNHGQTRDLDLSDKLDVSGSHAIKMIVTSQCRINGSNFDRETSFERPTQVPIWRLVHEEALVQTQVNGIICGFVVTLTNPAGSSHIFQMKNAGLSDTRPSPIQFDKGEPKKLSVKLRYQNSANAKAHLLCPDLKALPINFNNMITLSEFDIRNVESSASLNRFQACRVMISEIDVPVALSALIQIEPPDYKALEISTRPYSRSGRLTKSEALGVFVIVSSDRLRLAEVLITNPDKYPRKIKFVNSSLAVQVEMALYTSSIVALTPVTYRKNAYQLARPGTLKAIETATLNPGETLKLEMFFVSRHLNCQAVPMELKLKQIQPVVIQDLNAKDEVLAVSEFSIGDFYWSQPLEMPFGGPSLSANCVWLDSLR